MASATTEDARLTAFLDAEFDEALWADAQTKIAAREKAGKVSAAEAEALRKDAGAAILTIAPNTRRIADWAKAKIPIAPEGRVGAASLPGGKAFYAAAPALSTTTKSARAKSTAPVFPRSSASPQSRTC